MISPTEYPQPGWLIHTAFDDRTTIGTREPQYHQPTRDSDKWLEVDATAFQHSAIKVYKYW